MAEWRSRPAANRTATNDPTKVNARILPDDGADTPALFDLDIPGPADGVEQADRRTDWRWARVCDEAIAELAADGRPFECADLTDLGVPQPDHPNRWGPRFRAAAKAGVIRSHSYGPSRRPSRRESLTRFWVGAR